MNNNSIINKGYFGLMLCCIMGLCAIIANLGEKYNDMLAFWGGIALFVIAFIGYAICFVQCVLYLVKNRSSNGTETN